MLTRIFSHGKCFSTFLDSTNRTSVLVVMIVLHNQEREVTSTTRMSEMLLIVAVVVAIHDRVWEVTTKKRMTTMSDMFLVIVIVVRDREQELTTKTTT
jgi:hypothetical protein